MRRGLLVPVTQLSGGLCASGDGMASEGGAVYRLLIAIPAKCCSVAAAEARTPAHEPAAPCKNDVARSPFLVSPSSAVYRDK